MSIINGPDGERHNIDCKSSLAAGTYDPDCVRCKKISQTIALRRRSAHTAFPEEAISASIMANRLIERYKLTRGEIYDREYDTTIIAYKNTVQKASVERKKRTKMSQWDEESELK